MQCAIILFHVEQFEDKYGLSTSLPYGFNHWTTVILVFNLIKFLNNLNYIYLLKQIFLFKKIKLNLIKYVYLNISIGNNNFKFVY